MSVFYFVGGGFVGVFVFGWGRGGLFVFFFEVVNFCFPGTHLDTLAFFACCPAASSLLLTVHSLLSL